MSTARGRSLVCAGLVKRHVRAGKETIEALAGVDLQVDAGSVHAVIGPSGAGKSSLFRCVATLERPDAGHITLGDRDLLALRGADLLQARRRIGLVFQQLHLLPSLRLEDNVALPLRLAGIDQATRLARAHEMLRWVGLHERATSYPRELSGGQKQRVAIARALASDPSLLLCDEPTSALDDDTSIAIWELLRRARDDHGVTVLLITHQLEAVRRIADQVSTLQRGRVEATQSIEAWRRGSEAA